MLLPRMLDDAFKLTLDKHFPVVSRPSEAPPSSSKDLRREVLGGMKIEPKSSSESIGRLNSLKATSRKAEGEHGTSKYGSPSPYYVDGYNAYQNLWEKLYDFSSGKNYLKVKERHLRCAQMTYISETQDVFFTTRESLKAAVGKGRQLSELRDAQTSLTNKKNSTPLQMNPNMDLTLNLKNIHREKTQIGSTADDTELTIIETASIR